MTIINPKSISGITSITTASGADNLLTVHTNNTTERVRINNDGDVIVGSGITVSPDGDIFTTGVTTATTFVGALTGNVTGNATGLSGTPNISAGTIAGSTGTFSGAVSGTTGTFTGDVDIASSLVHTGDTDTKLTFTTDNISLVTGGTTRVNITSAGNLEMPNDNDYIKIGAGGDLSLVHNGSTSYVQNATGFLEFQSDGHRFSLQDGTEKARFDTSGRLLLGTTTEGAGSGDDLTISNSGDMGLTLRSTDSNYCNIYFSDATSGTAEYAGYVSYQHSTDSLQFATASTERMRLRTSTGGLMIGETGGTRIGEPKLHVLNGGSSNNVASFFFNTTDDRDVVIIRHNGCGTQTSTMIKFLNEAGNQVGKIASDTTNTVYLTSSDYRLKENEVLISDGITRLKTLKPYRFNFKDTPSKTVDGFFAHEVTAVPEAISGIKDETENILYKDDDELPSGKNVGDIKETVPKYQGIDQSKLVPLLTAALQEAVTKIEVLETRLNNAGIAT